ncbi:hybrid sensor histidine kinase/response regulator [Arcticibacterium luteifluviistationis]|uniref:histidine kinase n=1 Tax=Arcticibacterium luteifluviistationis TaxID=1784714 RepID=A0A2Z4GC63_9BACT|nr:ATP-binding protein [Arcticibacterium luteifluviistationis]AWV98727.1 hypothetical protein DJ013_11305 [Arcticibacterium luteifluviistationis]
MPIKFSLFACLVFFNLSALGQVSTELIDQSQVYAIHPTEEGKIYYITRLEKRIFKKYKITASLNFFDGYHSYELINLPGSFPSSVRFSIYPYKKNKLLIFHPAIHKEGIINLYIYDILTNTLSEVGEKTMDINAIHPSSQGLFSIGNSESGKTSFYEYRDGQQHLLFEKTGQYQNIAQANGLIYTFKNKNGLEVFDLKGKKAKEFNTSNIQVDAHRYQMPDFFFETKEIVEGKLVLNFEHIIPSVQVLNTETGDFESFNASLGENYGQWYCDNHGNSVVRQTVGKNACDNDLMFYFKSEKGRCVEHKLPNTPLSLASTDFDKNVWIGHEGGLFKVSFENNYVTTLLRGASLRAIYPLNDQEVLVGSEHDGLFLIDRQTGKGKAFLEEFKENDIFTQNRGFYKDQKENIWISSLKGFTIFSDGFKRKESIPLENLRNAFRMANKSIIGVIDKNYLLSINPISRTRKGTSVYPAYGYIQSQITLKDENKALLFGDGGFLLYDDVAGSVSIVDTTTKDVISGYKESEDIFWFGYENGKLSRNKWNGKELKELEEYNLNSGVATITPSPDGKLWIATFEGVAVFNPITKGFSFLDKSSLSHPESNRFSSFYDETYHKMYIGTVDGLSIIQTDKFESQNSAFQLFFSNISQSQKDQEEYAESSGFFEDIINLEIPAQRRYLRLRYSASSAVNNKNLNYFYRINNGSWIDNGKQNELLFPFLESGKHEIEIYAENSENTKSSNLLKASINVDSFYYQKWWFILIIVLIAISVIYYWYKRIKTENKRLENTVAERTDELKKDKETIENQALKLSELDELKNQFFANISHELRTPLTLIISPLERLLKSKIPEKDIPRHLTLMHENGLILKDRIAEMLELSRLTANKVKLSRQTVFLPELLKKNSRIFIPLAEKKNIDYQIEIDVPEVYLKIDERRLGKIIQNLLSNALKFAPEYGLVRFKATLKDSELRFSVKDNGIGISDENQQKIFDRFYQVKQDNTMANPGTGIGLTMVKEYLDLMNGQLHIESEEGKGSFFEVLLNVEFTDFEKFETLEEKHHQNTLEEAPKHIKNLSKPNLLLVEDNPQLRAYVKSILEKEYQIIEAENGAKAIKILEKNVQVDCILSDIMMPELDGVGLLNHVRQDSKLRIIPFVFLTAKHNEQSKLEAFRIGVDDYLTKPFDEDELVFRLRAVYKNYLNRLAAHKEDESQEPDSTFDFAQNLEFLVKTHLGNVEFSTTFLAEKMNLSRRHFIRLVKKEIGLNPQEYISEIRLNMARQLLETEGSQLEDVVEKVGFREVRYFKKLYFNRFGTKLN